ncbi:nucleotide disphospho-sugar-binding domain-containing protein [Streptomyces tendae]|uniref:nucleotide disphospho-sugar-binding domain-containing protein n=1 Tax=Streptomyces tendae TaxID=1932 RepID=UPI0037142866
MRVLFTVWPAPAHLNTMVPLALALQAKGHEVRVASHPDLAGAVTAAGLTAVALEAAGGMPALSTGGDYVPGEAEREQLAAVWDVSPDERRQWTMVTTYLLTTLRMFHPVRLAPDDPHPGVDGLVDFARAWRPHLVLWDPCWPAAAVAARCSGAAQARLLWGPDYWQWARDKCERHAAGMAAAGVADPLLEPLRTAAHRYDVEADDELLFGQWTIDPTLEDVRLPATTRTLPMRRLPHTAPAVVPDWLLRPAPRPRVALSLGMSGRDFWSNDALVGALLETVAGLDVEVVATLNERQLSGLEVPGNVRVISYLPLNELLPHCSAIIHHGGGGTFTAAVAHRVPQLIEVADGPEAEFYAACAVRHGAGLPLSHTKDSVPEMRERLLSVLNEPSFRRGARSLYADWAAMPSPRDVVPALERLVELGAPSAGRP